MCELCDFQEDLPHWMQNNSDLNKKEIEHFCERVFSVMHSFGEHGFEVTAGFSFREIDSDKCQHHLAHAFVKGEMNNDSVMVEFYPFSAIYLMCSRNVPGFEHCQEHYFDNMKFAKYVDDHTSKNWKQTVSVLIDAAINNITGSNVTEDSEEEKTLLRHKLGTKQNYL